MNTKVFRIISVLTAFILAWGAYLPGRATSEAALTPAQTVNIAYFYKPPSMDAASAVKNFSTMILTNGDHSYRDQLKANGFSSTIPEYFRSEAIQNPGSCSATPLNNQVAYKPGDFCSISQNHPDWFLLDSRGRRITVTDSKNYYRMDPGNPGWREFFVSRVIESQNQNGWSALFLDNVEASLGKFFGNNPAKYPAEASYQAAVAGFLQYLDVNYSQKYDRPFFGNIIVLGSEDVWFKYLQYLDGALTERFAVNWDESSYLRADKWEADMALMEKTQAQGKYVILVSPGYQNDLNRQNFAFASYLLISNGKAAFRYAKFSAYREAWLYDNYKLDLGSPLGARYLVGNVWRRDFTKGCVLVDPANRTAIIGTSRNPLADILIGGNQMGNCYSSGGQSQYVNYKGVNNGPVKIASSAGQPLVASEGVSYSPDGGVTYTSHSEMMGLPDSQLTNVYWFPFYNSLQLNTFLSVANMGAENTTVTITIGGNQVDSYVLGPKESKKVKYPNLNTGPVKVQGSNSNVPILTSERISYSPNGGATYTSYSEMMGLPDSQLTNIYWFPFYDSLQLNTFLSVANVGSEGTTVTVSIGGNQVDSYVLGPKQSRKVQYPKFKAGPVKIQGSNSNVPILASLRVSYTPNNTTFTSFSEMLGQPNKLLDDIVWFPWYNSLQLNTKLQFSVP